MNSKYLKTLEYFKIIDILAAYAQSSYAKTLVKEIMPETDMVKINHLLDQARDVIDLLLRKGSPDFEGVRSVESISKRLKINASLNNSELLVIRDNLYLARLSKEYIKEKNILDENRPNLIKDIFNELTVIRNLEDEIRRCIISPDEMADDASPELFRIRRSIVNLKAQVKDKLNAFIKSEKYKKFIQDAIITVRQDRYVIPVKREFSSEIKGIVHDMSSSGSTLFVEPDVIVSINNKVRELMVEEKEEMSRILAALSAVSLKHIDEITSNFHLMTVLDIFYAKGKFALDYRCTIPAVNDRKYINIKSGRHPLINKDVVVPIDFYIGDKFNTLVITGPNTGGKTVSLKTVGLLTLMTQAGIPIPAGSGTEIAIFNDVCADIGDEQSIEQSLSTFSSHMSNIITILKQVNQNTLVLFDELGAGTDPTEGAALALSILEYLMSKKCTTVATTHYSDIKLYASVTDNIENASCEFDVKTLSPTYKLLIGIPGKSNALYISRRLGLNQDIIENAKKFITSDTNDYEDVILSLEKSRQRIEKEEMKSVLKRKEIELIEKNLTAELNRIEIEKQKILKKAEEKANEIIMEAKRKSDELLMQLNRLKKDGKLIINAKEEAIFKNMLNNTTISSDHQKNEVTYDNENTDISVGDQVMVLTLNKEGSVLKLPDNNNEILVQIGIMKINVPLGNVRPVKNNRHSGMSSYNLSKNKTISFELDLRGMNLIDAGIEIEKYLDDCYMSGLSEVQIIHGKGTGALRKGVHDILKHNLHVKSYRIGKYGEGETGVTVVTLKNS